MIDDADRIPAWRRYLRLVRSDPLGDVQDELAFHIQSTIDEFVAAGMTPEAARDAARAKFGDIDGISRMLYNLSAQRERTMDRTEWWNSVKQDVVFGLRQLRKSPGFTATALITLALGIGANTAIFSVLDTVLLSPLPYASSDRVLRVYERNGERRNSVTFGNYAVWKAEARSFDAIGAYWYAGGKTLTGVGDPVPITGMQTNSDYWKALFIKPVLGSYYGPDDEKVGAAPVVVISEALWRNRFSADPSIVGKSIMLSGAPYRVLGVAPSDYVLRPPAELIWTPLIIPASRLADHKDHELTVAALVKRGVSAEQATRELSRIERRLAVEYPHSGFDDIEAMPLTKAIIGDQAKTIYMLFGAVTLVLLIACANVANLLVARAARRRAEIAVRGALGASRGRIVRQLVVESLLLGVAGGALGLGVAYAGIRFLVTSPAAIPRLQNTSLNGTVALFTLILSVGCALLFGLVPALRAARTDLQQTLRDGGRESAGGARDAFRAALVVSELCLAQVLLIGAALLIRSSLLVASVPIGFDIHNLLALQISLPSSRYPGKERVNATFEQLEASIASIPGVKSVGRAQVLPIYGSGWSWGAMREGSNGHDEGTVSSDMRAVSPGYFQALGIRFLRGRAFTAADGPDAPQVAIISRGLAKALYGDADPIGRRISQGSVEHPDWHQVVGVVDDVHADGPGDDPPLTMYMPASTWVNPGQSLIIRGNVPVTTLLPRIRRVVSGVDPLLALSNVSTIEESLSKILAMPRFTLLLLTLLGVTGLVLAIVGVYGVISYFVTQRSHEFGVRLALGASSSAVQWLVVRQGLAFATIGTAAGLALSFMAARMLQSLVFGITPHDPLTFAVVATVLAVVAVAASYGPARRATRIDPLAAIRG